MGDTLKIYISPQPMHLPPRGGVAVHLRHLYKYLSKEKSITLVDNPNDADLLHIESSYIIPSTFTRKKVVYVCHGGFVPKPLGVVVRNIRRADFIISVADWIIKRHFPEYEYKTAVIPNGIDLDEYDGSVPSAGYLLYGKEYDHCFGDFYRLAISESRLRFVTTYRPTIAVIPRNLNCIGLQNYHVMRSIIAKAGAVVLPGSEVCPMLLLEAWACGVPVIAKGIDGNLELMMPNNLIIGGRIYNNTPSMYDAANHVMMNRNALGLEGKEWALAHYRWDVLIKSYINLYELVMDSDFSHNPLL